VLCIEDDFQTERICNTGRICNYDVKKGRMGRIGGATYGMVYEGHSKPRSLARLLVEQTPLRGWLRCGLHSCIYFQHNIIIARLASTLLTAT